MTCEVLHRRRANRRQAVAGATSGFSSGGHDSSSSTWTITSRASLISPDRILAHSHYEANKPQFETDLLSRPSFLPLNLVLNSEGLRLASNQLSLSLSTEIWGQSPYVYMHI